VKPPTKSIIKLSGKEGSGEVHKQSTLEKLMSRYEKVKEESLSEGKEREIEVFQVNKEK